MQSKKTRTRVFPILTNLKSLTNQDQWKTVEDILDQIAKGNPTRTKEKETQTKDKQQHNKPSQKKCKNCRFKEPNIPITNLSNHQLSRDEISLLSKGLIFIPTPRRDHPAKMLQDILLFDRKIRLKYYFYNDSGQDLKAVQENTQSKHTNNQLLHPSSDWTSKWTGYILRQIQELHNK